MQTNLCVPGAFAGLGADAWQMYADDGEDTVDEYSDGIVDDYLSLIHI